MNDYSPTHKEKVIMNRVIYLLALFVVFIVGCSPNDSAMKEQTMQVKEYTESDACKALLSMFPEETPIRKALLEEQFESHRDSGTCYIETKEGQLSFNLNKKTFRVVQGINGKTGAPYESWGEFYVSDSGELKARFTGQAD